MLILQMFGRASTENAKYVYYLGKVQGDILMDLQENESLIDTLSTKEIADQIENLGIQRCC